MKLGSIAKRIDSIIEEMYIEGRFKIIVGNRVVAKGRNKWTRYFASALAQVIAVAQAGSTSVAGYRYAGCLGWDIDARVGTDTSTPTDPNMSDLVSKIDTAPSSKNQTAIRVSHAEMYAKYIFVWDTGVLPSGTIGEFGIYTYNSIDDWDSPLDNPSFESRFGDYPNEISLPIKGASMRLSARISSGDGDFNPIDYDNTKALKLDWRFIVATA